MKKFLKIPALLVLLAAGSLLSGCVASAGVGYSDVGPYYGTSPYYYGRPYPYYGGYYGYRPYLHPRPYARPYYRNNTTVIVQPPRRGVVRNSYVRPNTTFHNAPQPSYRHNNVQGHRQIRVR